MGDSAVVVRSAIIMDPATARGISGLEK